MLQTLDRYESEGTLSRSGVTGYRAWGHMKSGRLRQAQTLLEIARREDIKEQRAPEMWTFNLEWLKTRRTGRPAAPLQEDLARIGKDLLSLRSWALLAVEADVSEPLASLIARFHELEGRNSESSFVREELQFARGCLAFVRGDLKTARQLCEPLTANTDVPHRFHVLGRLYEAQRMWPEAAAQYEAVMKNPNLFGLAWPALWNLDRFRLAQVYERLGDTVRARALYERFADQWKDGDADIPELATARERLAVLSNARSSSQLIPAAPSGAGAAASVVGRPQKVSWHRISFKTPRHTATPLRSRERC